MNKITKIVAAGLLAAAAVTGLAGCGQSEQEKALAPYVGKWMDQRVNGTANVTETWNIAKDNKNENTLIGSVTKIIERNGEKKMDTKVHTIVYDKNTKNVKVDGTDPVIIQSDEKGEYLLETEGYYKNTKYYKQK